MHWSFGFLHILQVIGVESIVEHKGFSHWCFVWDYLKIQWGISRCSWVISTWYISRRWCANLWGYFSSVSHGILGTRGRLRTLNDMSVSWLFRWYSLVSVKGVAEGFERDRLMRVRLCVIMRVYSWVEVQRTRYYKAAIFRGNAVWFSKQICVWHNT